MTDGSVKWFDTKRGFGFILGPQGQDVFVHYSSIEGRGFRCLREGELVEFDMVETAKGLSASRVRVPGAQAPRRADKKTEMA